MTENIDPHTLRKLLRYEPDTGKLFWRERGTEWFEKKNHMRAWNTRFAGKEAINSAHGAGYRTGGIFGNLYLAHRVIWAMETGAWPVDQIDHINGDRSDNRMSNLRDVPQAENQKNMKLRCGSTSGITGVIRDKARGKWRANIGHEGKRIHLGFFESIDEAAKARKDAEKKYGYHENHGRKPSEATK